MSTAHKRGVLPQRFRIEVRSVSTGYCLEHTDIIASPTREVARMIVAMLDHADVAHGERTYATVVDDQGYAVEFTDGIGKVFSYGGRTR